MQNENWRPIPCWEGLYECSDRGRVRSVDRVVKGRSGPTRYRGRMLKFGLTTGYCTVQLAETGAGRREHRYVHDLVLLTFVGPKPPGMEVCHGFYGPFCNELENLRYDTRSANARDRHAFGKPWLPGVKKPPTLRECSVCGTTVARTRRRDAKHILCGSRECRSAWVRRTGRPRGTTPNNDL